MVQSFWNWVFVLIRFEDANDSISSSKESNDRTWHDLATQIWKISVLYILNQPLIRFKELGDFIDDTSEYVWKISEHYEVGWLLDKVVQEKDRLRDSNSQLMHPINY